MRKNKVQVKVRVSLKEQRIVVNNNNNNKIHIIIMIKKEINQKKISEYTVEKENI